MINMKKIKIPKFKRKCFILLILLSIYIITRLFFLFSVNLFNKEECRVGTIAKELIIGPSLPVFDYPLFLGPHYPGRLLEGLLTVPFYTIFGESGISVKLMFLTVSAGILCLVYLFLDKFFSRKAAIIAAMLMIFSVPVYTLSTMSQGGPHIESVFFDVLIMFLFYRIFFDKKQDIKSFIFFGLACGFAMFVNLSSLVMILTCFLFWFIFNKKFFLRKNFFIFIISFFIGSTPWIYYNLRNNFIGLQYRGSEGSLLSKVIGNELSFSRLTQIIIKFKDLVIYNLPKSFMLKDTLFFTSDFFSYTYYFLFICSFIFLLYYCRKSIKRLIFGLIPLERFNTKPEKIKKETFILVYPIILIIIHSISSFIIGDGRFGADEYRYLLTFYVFMFIIISLFLTKLWSKRTKILSISLIIILLVLGLIGNISFISFADVGTGVVYTPYCYDQLGPSYDGQQCSNLNKNYQPLCYAGNGVFVKRRPITKETAIIKHCKDMDKEFKYFCYIGLGRFFYRYYSSNITYIVLQCDKLDKNYRAYCYKGIGWEYGDVWAHTPAMIPQLCNNVNEYYKPYCFEGLGQGMSYFIGVIPTQAIKQCNKIEPEYRSYCFKGFGWSLADKFGDNPTGAGKFGKYVGEDYRSYFYKGIGSYIGLMFNYNLTRAEEECDKLGDNSIYCIQGLNQYFNETTYN